MATIQITQDLVDRIFNLTNRSSEKEIRDTMRDLMRYETDTEWNDVCDWNVNHALGLTGRGSSQSKTAQIKAIKAKYHSIVAEQAKAEQNKSDKKYIDENLQIVTEYCLAIMDLRERYTQLYNELNSELAEVFKPYMNCSYKARVDNGRASIVLENTFYELEMYYTEKFIDGEKRTLKVQTSSYGAITSEHPAVSLIIAQAQLLSNSSMQQEVCSAILKKRTVQK